MSPEEELNRAAEAAQIVNNKLFSASMKEIRDALIDGWQRTPVENTALREKIWAIYNGSVKFEELLRSHMETGKMAAMQLEKPKKFGLF